MNKSLQERAPKVVDFLKKYHTSAKLTNEALTYMQENHTDSDGAAKWFLKKHEEVWTKWVPEDVANKVKQSLK